MIDGADEGFHSGIILGQHLYNEIHDVVFDNLEVSRWFDNGITTPRNLETTDNSHLTIRNVIVRDVDNAGSPAQPATLQNITSNPLQLSSIAVTATFTQTNNCPATLAPGASCTISVNFTPSTTGPLYGTLAVTHNAGHPYTAVLVGG